MLLEISAAFLASLFFGIIFTVPRSTLFVGATGGSVAWFIYKLLLLLYNNDVVALFGSSIIVAIFSETMARNLKKTASTIMVPAIVPLVPGAGAYYTMLSFVKGQYNQGLSNGASTIFAAGAIAAGLAVVALTYRSLRFRSQNKC